MMLIAVYKYCFLTLAVIVKRLVKINKFTPSILYSIIGLSPFLAIGSFYICFSFYKPNYKSINIKHRKQVTGLFHFSIFKSSPQNYFLIHRP